MTHNVIPLNRTPARQSRSAPLVYTVREVAALLGLAVGTTYTLVREGTIPAERLGRRWVIPRARFHAWLDAMDDPQGSNLSATGTEHTGRRW